MGGNARAGRPDVNPFDAAANFLRTKYAEFQALGRSELPALHLQTRRIIEGARVQGNHSLMRRAQEELARISQLQVDWELQNDNVARILDPLRRVGITLGALPAAWVVAAAIAAASSIAVMFATRDKVRSTLAQMVKELPPDQAAEVILEYEREKSRQKSDWPTALITVAIAGVAIALGPQIIRQYARRR